MKTMIQLIALALMLAPLVSRAHDERPDACSPVFEACEAQGFTKDKDAAPGKKIWADCADPIINHGKMIATVKVTAKEAKKCKKFKDAKEAFEKKWNDDHKND